MNEQAHDKVPRLHLPEAPACNVPVAYFADGASPLLVRKRGLGELKPYVLPLANTETIETLRLLPEHFKNIRLCFCTNGLCLPGHLPFLQQIGLRGVTITVNGVTPEIVEQIQPWIRYRQKFYTCIAAAEMLIVKQLEGIIKLATRANIFIKINCVVLEGINSSHVLETVAEVKSHGPRIINLIHRLNATPDGLLRLCRCSWFAPFAEQGRRNSAGIQQA